MDFLIGDIETDGLIETVTKIHCFSGYECIGGVTRNFTLTDPEQIKQYFLTHPNIVLIGHNFIRYDIPVLELLLGIKILNRVYDTLGVSWYLYPMQKVHGLEEWGDILGIAKPKIVDWENLSTEEYVHRCEVDVKINVALFFSFKSYLEEIYDNLGIDRILGYISYKLQCAREQDEEKCRLDIAKLRDTQSILEVEIADKVRELSAVMPEKVEYAERKRPKIMHTKDGSLSALGKKWLDKLEEHGLDENTNSFKEVKKTSPGEPTTAQLKAWLTGLGWEPTIFSYKRDKLTNENKAIPQLSDKEGNICPNIKQLYQTVPALINLEGLTLLQHRIGVVGSMLECAGDGEWIQANVGGFTNTMRFKHKKPIVNLPKIFLKYGKEIRGSIIAPEGYVLCGSDMSSLEDSTKQHYMYFYDPAYVDEMRTPGFDPHLSIAEFAGMLTAQQVQDHKDKKENYSEVRGKAKVVNFSAVYGVGSKKMSLTSGMTIKECDFLLKMYWKKNWSVEKISEDCYVKIVRNQMWLYNPVSRLYYSLRFMKDRFSTLNQGTGVYCFDTWVRKVRAKGIRITFQYHDKQNFVVNKFR